jgi:hypothetical protein
MTLVESAMTSLPARLADDDRKKRSDNGGAGTAIITKTKPQTKRPSLYRVLLLNDDYTPMEFVVHILERFFNKDREAATDHAACPPARDRRMWNIYVRGRRDESDAGYGLCPKASASSPVRHGKEVSRTDHQEA